MALRFHSPSHVVLALLTLMFAALVAAGQSGVQLFHKMQTAWGGAEKIASIRDFEQIEHADTWDRNGRSRGVVRKRVRLSGQTIFILTTSVPVIPTFSTLMARLVGRYCLTGPLRRLLEAN
jgi:hypothetical protein